MIQNIYRLLVAGGLLVSWAYGAPPLSAVEFTHLAQTCAPEAGIETLRALARVESGFHPNALSINYPERASRLLGLGAGTLLLGRQPRSAHEALDWTMQMNQRGITTSIGLLQVNTEEAQRLGVPFAELLNPCMNLQMGWRIFVVHYHAAAQKLGPGQKALQAAISAYNTGSLSRGFANGYVRAVLQAATGQQRRRQQKKSGRDF